ncbi:MAG: hypothetical protein JXR94_17160 [Candidatus Hydrogenedentes bacterium]|nr:hypothetical protein [Candidatus Hydrogenedentota bacterium]
MPVVGAVLTGVALFTCGQAPAGDPVPVVIGVDTAGSYHSYFHQESCWKVPVFFDALRDLGVTHVNFHVFPPKQGGDRKSEIMAGNLHALDDAVRAEGMTYTLSIETPNFCPAAEITAGINEYDQPGGRHFWLLRPEWLRPLLPPARPEPVLKAVIYDEAAHMQLSNNKYSNFPKHDFDRPFFVDTHGLSIEEAYSRLVAECVRIRTEHYGGMVQLNTEQVWPDLFHLFARAGWTAAPKLLKEHLNPIVLSIALSAAVQYQDRGVHFWASPDLWHRGHYPGHPPESLRSALLMAYWLGAECIYVENVDFSGVPDGTGTRRSHPRHPEADPEGSLLAWQDRDHYALTAHGEVLRAFATEYVPAHPRTVDWRTYRPRVAIVRLPDGGWGQFDAGDEPFPHSEAASRNRLLGNREMPLDEAASEWLHVWPILTHGAAKDGAISYNNPMVYSELLDFFMPIDSVGVFDHEVRGSVLDGVECFVVCGHALSRETFDEIRGRVAGGQASCIIARRLYARHAGEQPLPGDWLIVDDFRDDAVRDALAPYLGPPDVARFRFEDQVVEFRRGERPNALNVRVAPCPDAIVRPTSKEE